MEAPSKMDVSEVDVAIVGLGPVGAMTALSLAHAGLRVLVLERSTQTTELPRAVGLDGESLRAFQRLGLSDAIFGLCQPPREPNNIGFANSKLETLFSLDIPPFGPNGWCDIVFFDQPELEVELRAMVAKNDLIEVRLGEKVETIEQDANGVTARTTSRDGSVAAEYRAQYLIGCDGASSFVREAMDIEWKSLDYDQDWLVIDVTQGENADLPMNTMQICDPERLATYICVKDPNRRWEFQILEGESHEEMKSPEKIHALLAPWTASENYTLRRAAVYQFHAAVADRWRVGRVFLAGDAAHQTPPFLGQGLNAGFRDAVNLGWKIPLVLANTCDDALLDSYATERDPHARELVDRAVSIGKLMETLAAREAGLPDPHPPESLNINVNGPMVPPIRGGLLIGEQCNEACRVGELMNQPNVRTTDGEEHRFDAALGDGFAIVGQQHSDLKLGAEAAAIVKRLAWQPVALEDFEVTKGHWDVLFQTHRAAIVRPDRYVYGVVDDRHSLDALIIELGKTMAMPTP